jgi:four helix bundle protein
LGRHAPVEAVDDAARKSARPRAIKSYEDIEAYRRAMALLRTVHDLVLRFPDYERYELASQIRRASKSIPTNIAEGYAKRRSVKEFKAFLTNALGSANEMEVHLRIAAVLGYVSEAQAQKMIEAYQIMGRQLARLIQSWRHIQPPASSFQPPTRCAKEPHA